MTLTRQDSKDLKRALGRGGIKQVFVLFNQKLKEASQPEISYETVSMTIRGLHDRQDIIDFAIDYARRVKAEKKTLAITNSNKIKELVEK